MAATLSVEVTFSSRQILICASWTLSAWPSLQHIPLRGSMDSCDLNSDPSYHACIPLTNEMISQRIDGKGALIDLLAIAHEHAPRNK